MLDMVILSGREALLPTLASPPPDINCPDHRMARMRGGQGDRMSVPSTTNTSEISMKLALNFSSWTTALADAAEAALVDDFKRAVERGKVARMYAYECFISCQMLGIDPQEMSPTMHQDALEYQDIIRARRAAFTLEVA